MQPSRKEEPVQVILEKMALNSYYDFIYTFKERLKEVNVCWCGFTFSKRENHFSFHLIY